MQPPLLLDGTTLSTISSNNVETLGTKEGISTSGRSEPGRPVPPQKRRKKRGHFKPRSNTTAMEKCSAAKQLQGAQFGVAPTLIFALADVSMNPAPDEVERTIHRMGRDGARTKKKKGKRKECKPFSTQTKRRRMWGKTCPVDFSNPTGPQEQPRRRGDWCGNTAVCECAAWLSTVLRRRHTMPGSRKATPSPSSTQVRDSTCHGHRRASEAGFTALLLLRSRCERGSH